jgi:O-antigen/teichoic acid export membrane protein
VRAKKNVILSFFIKGASILSQFALVPITINYLDKTQYGIWLTIASIVSWISFFDIGVGNGLRNKLAIALAKSDLQLARIYISTSYALLAIVFTSIIFLFIVINPLLNWVRILNIDPMLGTEVSKMILFVFIFFCLRFILMLINNILHAYQMSALSNLIGPLGNILSLIIIYILTLTTQGSLFWVGFVFSAVPFLVLITFNIFFFGRPFRNLAPHPKYINFNYTRGLLGLGLQFFIIQVAAIILFTSSNMILTQLFGPEQVTVYNIAYKYFTTLTMVYSIIVTPFWSAITEAFTKSEYDWIRSMIWKLEKISIGFVVMCFVMLMLARIVYSWWIGDSVQIPQNMNVVMFIFVSTTLLSLPYNTFVNAVGKVRLQLYSAVLSIVITIPLAIFFAQTLKFGPAGVVMATICTTFPTMILWRVQYAKIINNRATGIWNR